MWRIMSSLATNGEAGGERRWARELSFGDVDYSDCDTETACFIQSTVK